MNYKKQLTQVFPEYRLFYVKLRISVLNKACFSFKELWKFKLLDIILKMSSQGLVHMQKLQKVGLILYGNWIWENLV